MILPALALTSAACVLAGGLYVAPHLRKSAEIRGLRQRCARSGSVVLSYDDGPGTELTPRLLNLLREHDAKATFFALGRAAQRCPDVVERIIGDGHQLGCHSNAHRHPWKTWPWRAVTDMQAGFRALSRWIEPDEAFRPPHGKMNLPMWWALRKRGSPIGWWTVDSGDTFVELPDAGAAAEDVRRDGGGIVLIHDFDRSPERQEYVLAVTRALIEMAGREGLTLRRFCDVP